MPIAAVDIPVAPGRVDICCGDRKAPGFFGVDVVPGAAVDLVHDLSRSFPFADNSVEHLRAFDAIEHLPDRILTMNEIWRVLKPEGIAEIFVPSTDGRGAFQDPTHVSYWNRNSFYYYSVEHPEYDGLCRKYGFKGGFRIARLDQVEGGMAVIHVYSFCKP